jgi:hypothetical protein
MAPPFLYALAVKVWQGRPRDATPRGEGAFEATSLMLAEEDDLVSYPRRNCGQIRKALGLAANSRKPSRKRA